MEKHTCDKCNGTGVVSAYIRIDNGFCYKCNGSGKLSYKPRTAFATPKQDKSGSAYSFTFGMDAVTVIDYRLDVDGKVIDANADVVSYEVYHQFYQDARRYEG